MAVMAPASAGPLMTQPPTLDTPGLPHSVAQFDPSVANRFDGTRGCQQRDGMDEHPETSALLRELAADIGGAVGPDLVGLYVTGSYVAGGFDPAVSDLDLIAVTRDDAADLDLGRIRAMHAAFVGRHPEWSDRIEVVYIGADAVASFRSSHGSIAVISPGEPSTCDPSRPPNGSRTGTRCAPPAWSCSVRHRRT